MSNVPKKVMQIDWNSIRPPSSTSSSSTKRQKNSSSPSLEKKTNMIMTNSSPTDDDNDDDDFGSTVKKTTTDSPALIKKKTTKISELKSKPQSNVSASISRGKKPDSFNENDENDENDDHDEDDDNDHDDTKNQPHSGQELPRSLFKTDMDERKNRGVSVAAERTYEPTTKRNTVTNKAKKDGPTACFDDEIKRKMEQWSCIWQRPICYELDLALAADDSMLILKEFANIPGRTLILDIDGTSLKQVGGRSTNSRPISPIKLIYQNALRLGYKVFFVTARPAEYKDARGKTRDNATETIEELAKLGYAQFTGIFFRTEQYLRDEKYDHYKLQCRRKVENEHQGQIILNIGDNWEDMTLLGDPPCKKQFREKMSPGQNRCLSVIRTLPPKERNHFIYLWHFPDSHSLFSLKLPQE